MGEFDPDLELRNSLKIRILLMMNIAPCIMALNRGLAHRLTISGSVLCFLLLPYPCMLEREFLLLYFDVCLQVVDLRM